MKSISHYEQLAREAKGEGCGHHYSKLFLTVDPVVRCVDCNEYLSLGPSNDTPDAVRVEMLLAASLAEGQQLYEPGDGRDRAEEGAIDAAWDIRTVRECPHRLTPPPEITDADFAIVNHDAEQAETGGEG